MEFRCGHPKSEDNTYVFKGGYTYCKTCHKNRNKHYQKGNTKVQAYQKEYRKKNYLTRIKPRVKVIREQLLACRTQCMECGETHPACLDFHHRDPSLKSFKLIASQLGNRSWESIKTEIDKCDVLCSNCHRKHHYKIRQETN